MIIMIYYDLPPSQSLAIRIPYITLSHYVVHRSAFPPDSYDDIITQPPRRRRLGALEKQRFERKFPVCDFCDCRRHVATCRCFDGRWYGGGWVTHSHVSGERAGRVDDALLKYFIIIIIILM